MMNKNPETDIGIQPEDQKRKTISNWLLPLPQSENDDSASKNPQNETKLKLVSSHFIFLSKAGIKGMPHYYMVSMAN